MAGSSCCCVIPPGVCHATTVHLKGAGPSDTGSSLVTRFIVTSQRAGSHVRIEMTWQGAGGIAGFFEPRVLRGLYDDDLNRLDAYVQEQPISGAT